MFSQIKPTTDYEIYIVCRATKNKQNIIAKDFNLKDSLITHIGLGVKTNNGLIVYNVSNFKKSASASSLVIESLDEFLKIDDLIAYSVWSIKVKDIVKIDKLYNLIKKSQEIKVEFDYDFSLDNGKTKLYCSEFVYNMLTLSGIIANVEPVVKKLNPFYSKALKRNELEYIPVDFFQINEDFQKVNVYDI